MTFDAPTADRWQLTCGTIGTRADDCLAWRGSSSHFDELHVDVLSEEGENRADREDPCVHLMYSFGRRHNDPVLQQWHIPRLQSGPEDAEQQQHRHFLAFLLTQRLP